MKKLLEINDCHYCTNTDKNKCICLLAGKKYPEWGNGIPKWCPLPDAED